MAKPHRVLWQVLPNKGFFRWKLLRDSGCERLYILQARAIKAAKRAQEYEWEHYRYVSELQVHSRETGEIRIKDTYPRSSDPVESEG